MGNFLVLLASKFHVDTRARSRGTMDGNVLNQLPGAPVPPDPFEREARKYWRDVSNLGWLKTH